MAIIEVVHAIMTPTQFAEMSARLNERNRQRGAQPNAESDVRRPSDRMWNRVQHWLPRRPETVVSETSVRVPRELSTGISEPASDIKALSSRPLVLVCDKQRVGVAVGDRPLDSDRSGPPSGRGGATPHERGTGLASSLQRQQVSREAHDKPQSQRRDRKTWCGWSL